MKKMRMMVSKGSKVSFKATKTSSSHTGSKEYKKIMSMQMMMSMQQQVSMNSKSKQSKTSSAKGAFSPTATPSPSSYPTNSVAPTETLFCQCPTCTREVRARFTAGVLVTCDNRYQDTLMSKPPHVQITHVQACILSFANHPECEPCNPLKRPDRRSPKPTDSPTGAPTKTLAPTTSLPTHSPSTTLAPTSMACTCSSCTPQVLNAIAGGFPCGTRMEFHQDPAGGGLSEVDACRLVAEQYEVCSACNPDTCNN